MTDIITTRDKLRAVERELALRKDLYPQRQQQGKMSAGRVVHEQAVWEAIVRDYRAMVEEDKRHD